MLSVRPADILEVFGEPGTAQLAAALVLCARVWHAAAAQDTTGPERFCETYASCLLMQSFFFFFFFFNFPDTS